MKEINECVLIGIRPYLVMLTAGQDSKFDSRYPVGNIGGNHFEMDRYVFVRDILDWLTYGIIFMFHIVLLYLEELSQAIDLIEI